MTAKTILRSLKERGVSRRLRRVAGGCMIVIHRMVKAMPRFASRHRAFIESLIVGGLASLVLIHAPLFGETLAVLALVIAAASGIIRDSIRYSPDE